MSFQEMFCRLSTIIFNVHYAISFLSADLCLSHSNNNFKKLRTFPIFRN